RAFEGELATYPSSVYSPPPQSTSSGTTAADPCAPYPAGRGVSPRACDRRDVSGITLKLLVESLRCCAIGVLRSAKLQQVGPYGLVDERLIAPVLRERLGEFEFTTYRLANPVPSCLSRFTPGGAATLARRISVSGHA